MSWQDALVIMVATICASALIAWGLWIVHDSEPIEEDDRE